MSAARKARPEEANASACGAAIRGYCCCSWCRTGNRRAPQPRRRRDRRCFGRCSFLFAFSVLSVFFFIFSSSIEAIETIKFFLNLLHSFSFIPKPGGVRKIILSRFVLAASGTSLRACGAHGRASATRESRAKERKMKKPSAENETKARLLTSRASGRTRRFLAYRFKKIVFN